VPALLTGMAAGASSGDARRRRSARAP